MHPFNNPSTDTHKYFTEVTHNKDNSINNPPVLPNLRRTPPSRRTNIDVNNIDFLPSNIPHTNPTFNTTPDSLPATTTTSTPATTTTSTPATTTASTTSSATPAQA